MKERKAQVIGFQPHLPTKILPILVKSSEEPMAVQGEEMMIVEWQMGSCDTLAVRSFIASSNLKNT